MIKVYKLSNGTEVKVYLQKKGTESSKTFFGFNGYNDVYKLIIVAYGEKFTTTYHNSVVNYGKPIKEQDINDAVDCIVGDFMAYKDYPNINEFLHEFGYDFDDEVEYKRGVRAYNGCCSTYVRLGQMFTADEVIELGNIARGTEID
jgi:hypothetical protein